MSVDVEGDGELRYFLETKGAPQPPSNPLLLADQQQGKKKPQVRKGGRLPSRSKWNTVDFLLEAEGEKVLDYIDPPTPFYS